MSDETNVPSIWYSLSKSMTYKEKLVRQKQAVFRQTSKHTALLDFHYLSLMGYS